MTEDAVNPERRLFHLWKTHHHHDGDPDFVQIIKELQIQIDEIDQGVSQIDTGAGVHLFNTAGQSIAAGGEPIEWDEVYVTLPALEFAVTVPTSVVLIPKVGYYDFKIELVWDTWADGGSVWLERTRSGSVINVWPPTFPTVWESGTGDTFVDVAKFVDCQAGDTFQMYVDHGDASAKDLAYAVLSVELVHSTKVTPPVPQGLFIFTEDATFDWEAAGSPSTLADVWVIAGGGSGGGGTGDWKGGGGGAGGVLHLEDYAISGDVPVIVGLGGSANTENGEDSSFDGQVADGGGYGGFGTVEDDGASGGSGGGGATAGAVSSGSGGTSSQGNDGGDALVAENAAGGGGGFSAAGADGNDLVGGNGGQGLDLSAIVGTLYGDAGWFAGGGGGSGPSGAGAGGQGGGGDGATTEGTTGTDALVNSGGGGGGGRNGDGSAGEGGSGIVIVKVL